MRSIKLVLLSAISMISFSSCVLLEFDQLDYTIVFRNSRDESVRIEPNFSFDGHKGVRSFVLGIDGSIVLYNEMHNHESFNDWPKLNKDPQIKVFSEDTGELLETIILHDYEAIDFLHPRYSNLSFYDYVIGTPMESFN